MEFKILTLEDIPLRFFVDENIIVEIQDERDKDFWYVARVCEVGRRHLIPEMIIPKSKNPHPFVYDRGGATFRFGYVQEEKE